MDRADRDEPFSLDGMGTRNEDMKGSGGRKKSKIKFIFICIKTSHTSRLFFRICVLGDKCQTRHKCENQKFNSDKNRVQRGKRETMDKDHQSKHMSSAVTIVINLFSVIFSPASTALILECCLLILLFKRQVVVF